MKMLIAVSSKHGSTAEIAASIGQTVRETGIEVDVVDAGDVESVAPYNAVIVGSAVHMGRWMGPAPAMGAHRVIAQCNPANIASWRVLEEIGFVREGHLRRNIFFRVDGDGRPLWQDTFEYGLLNDLEHPPCR